MSELVRKVTDVELLESKLFAKAEKMVGGLTARSIVDKSDVELKEFISVTAGFLQKEKDLMAEENAVKAAKDILKQKRQELREATKEQRVLFELAVLTYSRRI